MSSKTGENFMKSTNKRSKFPAPEKRETLIKKSKLEQVIRNLKTMRWWSYKIIIYFEKKIDFYKYNILNH